MSKKEVFNRYVIDCIKMVESDLNETPLNEKGRRNKVAAAKRLIKNLKRLFEVESPVELKKEKS